MAHIVYRTYFSSFFDQVTGEKFHFQLESSKIAMMLLKLYYFSKGFLKTAHKSSGVQDFVFLSSYLDFPSNFDGMENKREKTEFCQANSLN